MARSRQLLSLALLLSAALLAMSAQADVVMSPPKNCPPGARGATGHSGPRCVPANCVEDKTCGAGTCQEHGVCVRRSKVGGRRRNVYYTIETFGGLCDGGASCSVGTCEKRKVCMPSGSKTPPKPTPTTPTQTTSTPTQTTQTTPTTPTKTTPPPAKPTPAPANKDGCSVAGTLAPEASPLALLLLLALFVWRRRR